MAKSRVIAGIDIGTSRIASLIAQYDQEEGKISVSGVGTVASKGIRKGQIVDIDEAAVSVIDSVEQAERMAGYSLDRAFVTIGGGHVDSRNSSGVVAVADPSGEISAGDIERVIDAARAISLPEARGILHVIPKEYRVDGETQIKDPEGMSGVRLEVETHLITSSATASKNIQKAVAEVGVAVTGLVFSGLASSWAVLTETERELGVVLVDIGAGTTSVVVFIEGALAHSFVLPIGGKNVTNDIAAGLRVSLDEAERIKITLGQKRKEGANKEQEDDEQFQFWSGVGADETQRKVSEKTLVEGIIKPRLNEIFTMVGMNTSEAGVAGKTPSGVVLTGGTASCIGAVEAARRMLSMPARIGMPTGVTGLVDEINNPSYAASVGLLIYAVQEQSVEHSWSPADIFSRVKSGLPVRGLVGRASELFRKILP